jgi:hypothetical protein
VRLEQVFGFRLCLVALVHYFLGGSQLRCQVENLHLKLLLVICHVFVGLSARLLKLINFSVLTLEYISVLRFKFELKRLKVLFLLRKLPLVFLSHLLYALSRLLLHTSHFSLRFLLLSTV